ncbi:hypothetical protein [Bacillus sp. MUM 13]|uniref:hypothetical protein n=1 Tax=Bacillus sp. MUM 13 TaxID=1678001 RepID=UPI0008F5B0E0|nr:hypothetical protein [Bacillus sp. MUM 13]OIK13787.1 hypothetical protein BIV59_04830 [Bacillus sp. MUM 13]
MSLKQLCLQPLYPQEAPYGPVNSGFAYITTIVKKRFSEGDIHSVTRYFFNSHRLIGTKGARLLRDQREGETPQAQQRRLTARPAESEHPAVEISRTK